VTNKISKGRTPRTVRGEFYDAVADIFRSARSNAYRAVNFAMVEAYWTVGRMIVEEEQKGEARAEYGQALLANLSRRLAGEFGKGFSEPNLRNFRQFYLVFPIRYTVCSESAGLDTRHEERAQIRDSLRPELSWSHYRLLLRIEKADARAWYMKEAADQNWSVRALERQINSLYYERLIMSRDKKTVIKEMKEKTTPFALQPQELVTFCYGLKMIADKKLELCEGTVPGQKKVTFE
jgi:hypothetical protein